MPGSSPMTRSRVLPDGRHLLAGHALAVGDWRPHRLPGAGEGVLHVGHRRSLELHAGVAPGRPALRRVSGPGIADAQPGDERHPAVDAHRLPVIAAHPPEGTGDVEGIEGPDLDPGLPQRAPESSPTRRSTPASRRGARTVTPSRAFAASAVDEPLSGGVVPEDVHLEVDVPPRRGDGLQPGGEVLRAVPEQQQPVPLHRRRAGSAGHGELEPVGRRCLLRCLVGRRRTLSRPSRHLRDAPLSTRVSLRDPDFTHSTRRVNVEGRGRRSEESLAPGSWC